MEFQTRGNFDLGKIAESGQVFNWRSEGDSYRIPSGHRICLATQDGDILNVTELAGADKSSESYWRHFFALDVDYRAILARLRLSADMLSASRGIRVLNQDWWDTAVCFILSQNSNIPRICAMVGRVSDSEGRILEPQPLANLVSVDACGMGYRQDSLVSFAEAVCGGWQPMSLSAPCTLEDQMAELQVFKGIGPKVASCICLFGLGFVQAVPHDTWIKKAEREYGIEWSQLYGGIQQQYVFNWIRNARLEARGTRLEDSGARSM